MPSSNAPFWAAFGLACPRISPRLVLDLDEPPDQLLRWSPAELSTRLGAPVSVLRRLLSGEVQAEGLALIEEAAQVGQEVVGFDDPRYPARLREIADPPPFLVVSGTLPPPGAPAVAIVGARDATPEGMELARFFGRELARYGLLVVSGGARGVDAAAHEGAVAGGGITVSVRGSGLDVDYPVGHRALFADIEQRGCSVCEHRPGEMPRPLHFPRRNRIISGWSVAVLVVEAGQRSGALVTARLALEQGREVLAIPGAVGRPQSVGTNRLIQDGARLVTCVEDILQEVAPQLPRIGGPGHMALRPKGDEGRVLELLDFGPLSVDDLASQGGLSAPQILNALLELELRGMVASMPGGRYRVALGA